MIKKDKLLKQIDAVTDLEKRLIPLFNKHISTSLFFSGLGEKERDSIKEQFQKIAISKTKHLEVLAGIKNEVTKGKNDVY